jgi:erythromycin esterase-like protein
MTALRDAESLDAESVVGMLGRRPRVLALGEPTHGSDVLLGVRNSLFRDLVEREGYRTVALESDCLAGLVTDAYVTTGAGSLDDVMARGFSHHDLGAGGGNRALVRWMRAYNDGRPAAEQVRFAGFDGPVEMTGAASPREALIGLHGFLADRVPADLIPCSREDLDGLLGADAQWTNPAAVRDPAQAVGRTRAAERLRLIADDLVALLDMHEPHPGGDVDRARMYGRTAVGLLRYHHRMADTSPARWEWLAGVRASMMAANLLALAERGPVLAHAHNGHLQRHKSGMRMGGRPLEWWSAGAIVSARLGAQYAFLATALGELRHHGVDAPPADTIEGILSALPRDQFVVDPRRLGDVTPRPRTSPWYGYAPLDPAHVAGTDGVVFVKDASAFPG